jgi:hypothetical protein
MQSGARDLLCRQALAKVSARHSNAFSRVIKVHAHDSGVDAGCTRVPQVANLEPQMVSTLSRPLRRLISGRTNNVCVLVFAERH